MVLGRAFGGLVASFLGTSFGMTLGLTKGSGAAFGTFLILCRAFDGLGTSFLGTSFGITLGLTKGSGAAFGAFLVLGRAFGGLGACLSLDIKGGSTMLLFRSLNFA